MLPVVANTPDGRVSEELCAGAAAMATNLDAAAIFVYTKRGYMANFLSRCRPDCPIFAFTDTQEVRQRMNLRWGVIPFRMDFSGNPEENVQRTFRYVDSLFGYVSSLCDCSQAAQGTGACQVWGPGGAGE